MFCCEQMIRLGICWKDIKCSNSFVRRWVLRSDFCGWREIRRALSVNTKGAFATLTSAKKYLNCMHNRSLDLHELVFFQLHSCEITYTVGVVAWFKTSWWVACLLAATWVCLHKVLCLEVYGKSWWLLNKAASAANAFRSSTCATIEVWCVTSSLSSSP